MKELSLKDVSLARPYRVYSLERGLHLLEVLAEGAPEKSLTEVSQKSGFNLSTTHRILTTLKYRGYVRQNGSTSKYRLTFKLFELGNRIVTGFNLREEAMPILTDLAEKTGTSAYLIVLDNDEALCLERIDCHHNFQVLFLKIGGRMPLHIGAGSRVLLAYLPEMEIEKIVKSKGLCPRTKYSIANYQALEKNLQKIRKQGYALSWKDVHEGAAALGCPVRNWKNEVVAAISISGMADDFSKQRLPHLVQMVKDASCELSHRLSATV